MAEAGPLPGLCCSSAYLKNWQDWATKLLTSSATLLRPRFFGNLITPHAGPDRRHIIP